MADGLRHVLPWCHSVSESDMDVVETGWSWPCQLLAMVPRFDCTSSRHPFWTWNLNTKTKPKQTTTLSGVRGTNCSEPLVWHFAGHRPEGRQPTGLRILALGGSGTSLCGCRYGRLGEVFGPPAHSGQGPSERCGCHLWAISVDLQCGGPVSFCFWDMFFGQKFCFLAFWYVLFLNVLLAFWLFGFWMDFTWFHWSWTKAIPNKSAGSERYCLKMPPIGRLEALGCDSIQRIRWRRLIWTQLAVGISGAPGEYLWCLGACGLARGQLVSNWSNWWCLETLRPSYIPSIVVFHYLHRGDNLCLTSLKILPFLVAHIFGVEHTIPKNGVHLNPSPCCCFSDSTRSRIWAGTTSTKKWCPGPMTTLEALTG